jgi:hypothetical protein
MTSHHTVSQVAEQFAVPERAVRHMVRKGELDAEITEESIERLLARSRRGPGGAQLTPYERAHLWLLEQADRLRGLWA